MPPPTTLRFLSPDRFYGDDINMLTDDRFPRRKSPRLARFDYSAHNDYFITICTKGKTCLFGSADRLSPYEIIARECLEAIPSHAPGAVVEQFVVMPNHVHAILALEAQGISLPTVIGGYKSAVTRKIRETNPGLEVWQTSFYDHVIRNREDYRRIWEYIYTNPARWMDDCFHVPEAENKT